MMQVIQHWGSPAFDGFNFLVGSLVSVTMEEDFLVPLIWVVYDFRTVLRISVSFVPDFWCFRSLTLGLLGVV